MEGSSISQIEVVLIYFLTLVVGLFAIIFLTICCCCQMAKAKRLKARNRRMRYHSMEDELEMTTRRKLLEEDDEEVDVNSQWSIGHSSRRQISTVEPKRHVDDAIQVALDPANEVHTVALIHSTDQAGKTEAEPHQNILQKDDVNIYSPESQSTGTTNRSFYSASWSSEPRA